MYLRPVHSDLDPEVCHAFVKANPLGLLITHLPSPDTSVAAIQASHIPFVIDLPPNGFSKPEAESTSGIGGSKGKIRGHMARANPQVKAILAAATSDVPAIQTKSSGGVLSYILGSSAPSSSTTTSPPHAGTLSEDVCIIFTSPTHSYVTPTFYTETKPTTHKVVPTWDYAAVQVYGKLRVYNKGEEADAYLQKQVEDLTNMEESKMQQACPAGVPAKKAWRVDEAPKSYVDLLKKGIMGVEIEISRIEGKWKMSQENEIGDWEGVVDGFKGLGTEDGKRMAKAVEDRGTDRVRSSKVVNEAGAEQIAVGDGTDHQISSASLEEAK